MLSDANVKPEAKLRLAILYALRYQKYSGNQITNVVDQLLKSGVEESRAAVSTEWDFLFLPSSYRRWAARPALFAVLVSTHKVGLSTLTVAHSCFPPPNPPSCPSAQLVFVALNFAGAEQRQDDLFANENFFSRGKSALKGLKVRSWSLLSPARSALHHASPPLIHL